MIRAITAISEPDTTVEYSSDEIAAIDDSS